MGGASRRPYSRTIYPHVLFWEDGEGNVFPEKYMDSDFAHTSL